jgi:hypothetical protein
MSASAKSFGPPKELSQLLRLRQVRVDAAEAQVRAQRAACEAAQAVVEQRQRTIEEDRRSMAQQAEFAVGQGAVDLPRMAAYVNAFRASLKDKIERGEYALGGEKRELEDSRALLVQKQREWMREQSRHKGIEEALRRSRRAKTQRQETQAEDEVDELRRSGPMSASASASTSREHNE